MSPRLPNRTAVSIFSASASWGFKTSCVSTRRNGVTANYHLLSERVDEEPGPELDLDQAVIEGVAGELGSAAEAELLLDV
jgi:hypothetical protein